MEVVVSRGRSLLHSSLSSTITSPYSMASSYIGYDYGIVGSSTTVPSNPNPFVYNPLHVHHHQSYDAPFYPQLDHLSETRAQEWRVQTTTTTSALASPWTVGTRSIPSMSWQTNTVVQPLTPVHHSSVMIPLQSSASLLHSSPPSSSLIPPLHNPISIDIPPSSGRSSTSLSIERRLRKPKLEPATSPVRPFSCQMCGKSFSQAANLTAHRRVHTGEKPFLCPICQRPFSQSSSLVTHKRTHSGERPYNCSHCDKCFTDSSTLTKHLRTHTGHKPYSCHMCLMRFTQSGNLHRHMKTHKNS